MCQHDFVSFDLSILILAGIKAAHALMNHFLKPLRATQSRDFPKPLYTFYQRGIGFCQSTSLFLPFPVRLLPSGVWNPIKQYSGGKEEKRKNWADMK